MSMRFILVKKSLVDLLGTAQGAEWKTIGFIERDQSAKENNTLRTLQVFYNSGNFQKTGSSIGGPVYHDMEFRLVFTVAEASEGDIDALNSATTPAEYIAANETFIRSEELADERMDDFLSRVWTVLMDARNRNLGVPEVDPETGFPVPKLSGRWLDSIRKEEPKQRGAFCTMRAQMPVTAKTVEEIVGFDVTGRVTYQDLPYEGADTIKDNIPQSGNEVIPTP